MAMTGWLNATIGASDSGYGTLPWNSTGDIVSDNTVYATGIGAYPFAQTILSGSVKLAVGGVIVGDNRAGDDTTAFVKGSDTDLTFGSSTDTWGITPSVAEVNASNFGVAFADDQGSYYLLASGFGASVPAGNLIKGIEAVVQVRQFDNGFSYSFSAVDVMQVRIHYGTDHTISGGGTANGMLLQEFEEADKLNKFYQFKIYNRGVFLGEWTNEVASEPQFKLQINTIGTHMAIKLGRTIDSIDLVPEQLYDQSGDDYLSQDGDTLIGYTGAGNKLGPDSDADVNYDVNVNAYYGGYDYLVTQDGEPLVTQDFELLFVVDGAPEGRSLITGFISNWRAGYNGDESVNTNMATYGWELNQIILETEGTTELTVEQQTGVTGFGLAASGGSSGTYHTLVQTLAAPSTGLLEAINIPIARGVSSALANKDSGTGGPVTLDLYAGATATGTPLATITVSVPAWTNTNNASTYAVYSFVFADYELLTNASTYTFRLKTTKAKITDYPIYIGKGVAYSGGAATHTNGSGSTTSGDVAFSLDYAGGYTTRTFNSYDPSNIMRAVVDFAASKGAHIQYTADSIYDSGTLVSYTFNTNTITEAVNKVLELAPSDWYYYIDPADNTLYFKPRPATPDHTFTLGRDIARFEIERDMEDLTNVAYFSGGGDPALFIKQTDQTSLSAWRRGLIKLSDNRVTDTGSAETLAQGHIDRNNEPQYLATLVMAAANYDIETIKPGQLAALAGAGNFIDELRLQISEVEYKFDTATLRLGTIKPPVSKRLEDLRRNLDVLEQQNNPNTPG